MSWEDDAQRAGDGSGFFAACHDCPDRPECEGRRACYRLARTAAPRAPGDGGATPNSGATSSTPTGATGDGGEDAEWDAMFAAKADALAAVVADTKERVARGEATPLDMSACLAAADARAGRLAAALREVRSLIDGALPHRTPGRRKAMVEAADLIDAILADEPKEPAP